MKVILLLPFPLFFAHRISFGYISRDVVSNQIVHEESHLKFTQCLSIAKDHEVLLQETVMMT